MSVRKLKENVLYICHSNFWELLVLKVHNNYVNASLMRCYNTSFEIFYQTGIFFLRLPSKDIYRQEFLLKKGLNGLLQFTTKFKSLLCSNSVNSTFLLDTILLFVFMINYFLYFKKIIEIWTNYHLFDVQLLHKQNKGNDWVKKINCHIFSIKYL